MQEERAAPWAIGGAIVVFKLLTTALIILCAPDHIKTVLWLFLLLHWPFILGGLILAAAPLAFWIRRLRVRARRARLLAEEWQVEQRTPIPDYWTRE
jgi:hypothetical protein